MSLLLGRFTPAACCRHPRPYIVRVYRFSHSLRLHVCYDGVGMVRPKKFSPHIRLIEVVLSRN